MHVFPWCERFILWENSPWKEERFEALDIKNLLPQMYAYVHRFRAHPMFKDEVITQDAYNKSIARSKVEGKKMPLSVAYLN